MCVQVAPSALSGGHLDLYLHKSRALRAFKDLLGQANHLIITCLVGLDAIERGKVTAAPPELHTVWSPKVPAVSALRARRLLLDMALARSVDALDAYVKNAIRNPKLVQGATLRSQIDAAGISVYRKYKALCTQVPQLDPVPVALVDLMIAWRNQGTHSDGDNEPSAFSIKIIENNADAISHRFSGLDGGLLLASYSAARDPTFKEIASFINATHHFVTDVERSLIARLDSDLYLRELVRMAGAKYLSGERLDGKSRKRQFQSIWGKDPTDRPAHVVRFLVHQGLSTDVGQGGARFGDDLISGVCAMTPSQVDEWSKEDTLLPIG